MSTANDIRYAASFDEPLGLDMVACEVLWEFSTDYEGQFKDNNHERTFMLFVAEALDGGRQQCEWTQDPDWGSWETECENVFELIEGTPKENKMAYCCYCGGELKETT